jgi:hypothetical protein
MPLAALPFACDGFVPKLLRLQSRKICFSFFTGRRGYLFPFCSHIFNRGWPVWVAATMQAYALRLWLLEFLDLYLETLAQFHQSKLQSKKSITGLFQRKLVFKSRLWTLGFATIMRDPHPSLLNLRSKFVHENLLTLSF